MTESQATLQLRKPDDKPPNPHEVRTAKNKAPSEDKKPEDDK